MRPIPETAKAIDEFGPFELQNKALFDRLVEVSHQIGEVVPDCLGLSLTLRELDVTFTLVASSIDIGVLDAVQYIDGGPCVEAILDDTVVSTRDDETDPLAEDRWHLFALARSAYGVASTLSLPILDDDSVIGGFNLYAGSPGSFDGHHDRLAGLLGAWAEGAVTNADLAFSTHEMARRAPQILQQGVDLAVVSGLLAAASGTEARRWEERIRTASARAGVPLGELIAALEQALRSS